MAQASVPDSETNHTDDLKVSAGERRDLGDDRQASVDLQQATSQMLYRLECRADDLLDKDNRQIRDLRELCAELRELREATAAE